MIWSASSERATPHTGKNDRILAAEEVADLGSQGNRQGPAHRPSNTLRSTTAWLCCSSWAAYIRVSLPRRAIARNSARPVRFARSSAALLELCPASGIVPKPFAQLGARRDLLHPLIERCFLLADAARPKSVDQDPRAVVARRRLIGALQSDVPCGDRRRHVFVPQCTRIGGLPSRPAIGQHEDIAAGKPPGRLSGPRRPGSGEESSLPFSARL